MALLGARLRTADGIELMIVETEAYGGLGADEASHAHRGATARTEPMFGPVAHLYVYRSYGIHLCVNIVCHPHAGSGAVLLRAARVTKGEDLARQRRSGMEPAAKPSPAAQDDSARSWGWVWATVARTSWLPARL